MGPPPAVAAVRLAVRRALRQLDPGDLVLVACSGGADSLALAAATAFEAPRAGLRAGAVTVDHGLQPGSADRADQTAAALRGLGLDPVETAVVRVGTAGGPESAARHARYAALAAAAARHAATAVLLGHTLDDQAETVLLGLARGSGARSLAGMSPDTTAAATRYLRPLLGLDRATTERACTDQALSRWRDPHNTDPAFTRVRVRHQALPALTAALGPGVAAALARTAELLRADADALDGYADLAYAGAVRSVSEGGLEPPCPPSPGRLAGLVPGLTVALTHLTELPAAVRTRVLRRAALAAGCPATDLTADHVRAVDALVTAWRGQGPIQLPGPVHAVRAAGLLVLGRPLPVR